MTQPLINTTSADIASWREAILTTLCRGHGGYAAALEADAENQRRAETQWLSDGVLFPARRASSAGVSLGPAVLKNFHGSDVAMQIVRSASTIASAPEAASYAAKHLFVSAVCGEQSDFSAKIALDRDDASIADIRHEAAICIFGTNAFRVFIPNFPFVYAYVKAAVVAEGAEAPLRAPSPRRKRGAAAVAAPPATETHCLVIENICPETSTTLTTALESMSVIDFYAVLIQIALALKFAYDRIGFTHYDLHTDNVVLRGVGGASPTDENRPWFYIPYEAGRAFVAARSIATFTDFGFSHALLQNSAGRQVCFGFSAPGRASLVELGIFRDRPNAMTDVYRLLLTAASRCRDAKNDALLAELAHLVRYFNQTETLDTILDEQQRNFYYLPLTSHARAYNFDDFLTHAKRAAKPHVAAAKTPPLYTLAAPRRTPILLSGSGFMDGAGLVLQVEPITHHYVPATFAAFFDIHSSITMRNVVDAGPSRSADLVRELRANFTRAYMRGYAAAKNAAFNRCLSAAADTAKRLAAKVEASAAEAVADEAAVERVATVLSAVAILIETQRAAFYTAELYWPVRASSGGGPPPDVANVFREIDVSIRKTCEIAARVESELLGRHLDPATTAEIGRLHAHVFSGVRARA